MANQNTTQQKNMDKNQKQASNQGTGFTSSDRTRESDISKQTGTTTSMSKPSDKMGRADETSKKANFEKR